MDDKAVQHIRDTIMASTSLDGAVAVYSGIVQRGHTKPLTFTDSAIGDEILTRLAIDIYRGWGDDDLDELHDYLTSHPVGYYNAAALIIARSFANLCVEGSTANRNSRFYR